LFLSSLIKPKILLTVLMALSLLVPTTLGKAPDEYIYTLTYSFQNRGTTEVELNPGYLNIPRFMNTSWQTVTLENLNASFEAIFDDDGNKGVYVNISRTLSPGQKASFTAVFRILSMEKEPPDLDPSLAQSIKDIPESLVAEYTMPTETFPSDDPMFYEAASNITRGEETVLGSVVALVEYIKSNISYENFEMPQYPVDTLENKLGDCDDQSILFITLCRSIGIPAYLQIGVFFNEAIKDQSVTWDGHIISEAEGVIWHGWAMVYVPPWGWIPVDLTLTGSDDGLKVIESAPQYRSDIVPVMNVSRQSYIGDTLEAYRNISTSSIYLTMTEEAYSVSDGGFMENHLLLGLGAALIISVWLMFYYRDRK